MSAPPNPGKAPRLSDLLGTYTACSLGRPFSFAEYTVEGTAELD